MSDLELTAHLEGLFNRRPAAPSDPNAPAQPAPSRPILDAIKAGLAPLISSMFQQLGPALLPLLLKLIAGGVAPAASTKAVELDADYTTADVNQIVHELARRHSVIVHAADLVPSSDVPLWGALENFLANLILQGGDEVLAFLVAQLHAILQKIAIVDGGAAQKG